MISGTRYLLVFDFDGTAFDTFEPNSKGIGVHEAYRLAVKDIFGEKGVQIYDDCGGLKNRAPEEIVYSILNEDKTLLGQAESCFDSHCKTLRRLVPEGKGAPLEWVASDNGRLQKTIAEMLVLIKLSYLMDEIGSRLEDDCMWPRPCKGFIQLLNAVRELRSEGIDVQCAIISSGHELFIRRTFESWGYDLPPIVLSDDDMRGKTYPVDFKQRVKPSPYLFDLVQAEWISEGILFSSYARHIEMFRESRQRMIYFGDDLSKDGELAKNAGVPFGLFDPKQKIFERPDNQSFVFQDWGKVADFLRHEDIRERLRAGEVTASFIPLL